MTQELILSADEDPELLGLAITIELAAESGMVQPSLEDAGDVEMEWGVDLFDEEDPDWLDKALKNARAEEMVQSPAIKKAEAQLPVSVDDGWEDHETQIYGSFTQHVEVNGKRVAPTN